MVTNAWERIITSKKQQLLCWGIVMGSCYVERTRTVDRWISNYFSTSTGCLGLNCWFDASLDHWFVASVVEYQLRSCFSMTSDYQQPLLLSRASVGKLMPCELSWEVSVEIWSRRLGHASWITLDYNASGIYNNKWPIKQPVLFFPFPPKNYLSSLVGILATSPRRRGTHESPGRPIMIYTSTVCPRVIWDSLISDTIIFSHRYAITLGDFQDGLRIS